MWQTVVLTIISVLLVPTLVLLWKIVHGLAIFQEFPPHLHVGTEIRYPKGMKPEPGQHLDSRAEKAV
jgi:hypothetical protein